MSSPHARRRAESRVRVRRQRRRVALVLLVAVVAAVLAAKGGGSSHGHGHSAARRAPAVVPGGPLAPAYVGGLASLWAPRNVVGSQPGTAAAYEAASRRPGPAGYILIADRGNNRVLVVNPQGQNIGTFERLIDAKLKAKK